MIARDDDRVAAAIKAADNANMAAAAAVHDRDCADLRTRQAMAVGRKRLREIG